MKKWIILFVAAIATQVWAGDFVYKYLVLTDSDGNQTALSTEGLQIELGGTSMTVSNSAGEEHTFQLASLASMAFAETAPDVTTAIDAGRVSTASQSTAIETFNLSGIRLGTFNSMNQLKSTLGKGVYIVKQNGTTKKITIQ